MKLQKTEKFAACDLKRFPIIFRIKVFCGNENYLFCVQLFGPILKPNSLNLALVDGIAPAVIQLRGAG